MNIYDFSVIDANGKSIDLKEYSGKVLLIVNTATGCGYTPQYAGLETLYEKYKDQGFEILDFPCNQFFGQAPGTEAQIVSFCQTNYGVSFKTFKKILVNGKDADPLFRHLKQAAAKEKVRFLANLLEKLGFDLQKIKWNFTKFLIDGSGAVVSRYEPSTKPEAIEPAIKELLEKTHRR